MDYKKISKLVDYEAIDKYENRFDSKPEALQFQAVKKAVGKQCVSSGALKVAESGSVDGSEVLEEKDVLSFNAAQLKALTESV